MFKEMIETCQLLSKTPLPIILVLTGLFFVFLAVVEQIGKIFRVSNKSRQKILGSIGGVMFTIGIILFITPPSSPPPFPMPTPTIKPTMIPTTIQTPTSKTQIFQNFEEQNGTPQGKDNYYWDAGFASCEFTMAPNPVHEGQRAIQMKAEAYERGKCDNRGACGGTIGIKPASSIPVDLSSAQTLSVWVYDTVSDIKNGKQVGNTIQLKLRDSSDKVSSADRDGWSINAPEYNTWTEITWNLSKFAGIDKSQITGIELYEWKDGIYYFDDIGWK